MVRCWLAGVRELAWYPALLAGGEWILGSGLKLTRLDTRLFGRRGKGSLDYVRPAKSSQKSGEYARKPRASVRAQLTALPLKVCAVSTTIPGRNSIVRHRSAGRGRQGSSDVEGSMASQDVYTTLGTRWHWERA
ncbi:hypothetical protein Bbelb_143110 [Branchiostoma belcheri]|nr:hypothetical protein Bbelb_143110 [Branchiostoma belcheri]